jgi:hypothetical protein
MKKVLSFLIIVVALVCQVRGQYYEYRINARTGKFDLVNSAYGILNTPFNGNRTVTRAGLPAINTGDSTLVAWINSYFFPEPSPVVTIAPVIGNSLEFMVAGLALNTSLNWSVQRPAQSTAISSITVNGVSITPDPIVEGATQTGTLINQALNRNIVTTYAITAFNTSGYSSTRTTTIQWFWKRYWGAFASSYPPTDVRFSISDAQVLALTGAGIGTGNELSTTLVKNYDGISAGGNYLVFAWPASWGQPIFVINGLISTAFTRVRSNSFTNASGGVTNYDVWVSDTELNAPIAQFQINKQ